MNTMQPFDAIDHEILNELSIDGRLSFRELARRVGLSTPAVTERVRKLRAQGTIRGFRADVDIKHLGFALEVSISLDVAGSRLHDTADEVAKITEVSRCRRLTGDACFLIEAAVTSTEHLQILIDRLAQLGTTTTSLVISTPVPKRLPTISTKVPKTPNRG